MDTDVVLNNIDVKSVMTKSSLPVGGYSVNPYVGCPHACKYCYASFMKRFTGHTEPWGSFLDVKHWRPLGNPHKYDGQRIVIGSVTVMGITLMRKSFAIRVDFWKSLWAVKQKYLYVQNQTLYYATSTCSNVFLKLQLHGRLIL